MATENNNPFDGMKDDDIRNTLNAWRESAAKQSERPDWYWARQRALLSSEVQHSRMRRVPVLAWAGIAATVALGVALLSPGQKQNTVDLAADDSPQAYQMTDRELMQQLDQTMNSGVPEALQPANALAQEMEAAYSTNATSKVKERTQ